MAVRRLYEPLCIAFGTTVSSPTVPTYQLYDLPHKFTPRLYMESEDPNLVLREIGLSLRPLSATNRAPATGLTRRGRAALP